MIEISVDTRRAVVTNKEILTSGSAGIQVQFTLSEDWTGLSKLAVFRTGEDGESIDVVLDNNLNCVVPAEALQTADEVLFIGVYGSDGNGTVIIPTIWAAAGVIRPGTEPNTPAEAEPTPEIWAQILSVAQEAETTATGAMNYVEQAVSDLGTLEDRVSDNEEDRVAAEQARASAEDTRAEAETARITNEDSRINAESNRNTAEVARSMAETARADAEAARVTAEQGRVTAENERAAAEAIREEKYAEYVETVSGYADDAEASAEAARTSMINAQTASGSASQSATSANNSATTATSKANEASSWASTALNAAGNAATSQSAAAQSASAAAASQTAAETAQTAAEAAQSAAEDAQDAAETAQAAAEAAASSISGKSAQIDQNTSDISDLSRQLSNLEDTVSTTQIINSASGAIASFDDGADNMPVRKLVANIEPVQDLHGYDSPWPAGGGKNTAHDITYYTVTSRYSAVINATYYLEEGKRYIFSFMTPNSGIELYRDSPEQLGLVSASGYAFTCDGTRKYFYGTASVTGEKTANVIKRASETSEIGTGLCSELMIEQVADDITTPTAYAPYSNICPISGHTGAEIEQRGKNLFGGEALRDAILAVDPTATTGEDENGRYVTLTASVQTDNKLIFKMPFKANTSYTAIYKYKKNNTNAMTNLAFRFENGGDQYLTKYSSGDLVADTVYTEKTTTQSGRTILQLMTIYASARATLYYDYFGIFEGNVEIADFVPYTGNQISIDWEDEAGTVYGGQEEVVSGGMKRTMIVVDLGALNWTRRAVGNVYDAELPVAPTVVGRDAVRTDCICSAYKSGKADNVVNGLIDNSFTVGTSYGGLDLRVVVCDSAYTSTEDFKAAVSGVQLCYTIAEPQTYQLAENPVDTLYGTNNIWSDTGDTTVEYPADTKLYIDGKIAEAIAALNA